MTVNRERKMVNKEQENADFEGYTLKQVLERVQYLIETYGEDATIDEYVYPYSDGPGYSYVWKKVPETDDQMNARIAEEERYTAQHAEYERKQYEMLKAKFGSN